jgi:alanine racemase
MNSIHQELSTRPTFVEVDLENIRHNLATLRNYVGDTKVLCIVKGNAYGHGSVRMAQLFEELGVDYLGVAIPEEGVELRRAGITTPILVLSAIADRQIPVCIQYDLTITVPSDDRLKTIDDMAQAFKKKVRVHLKVDTGMGRIGVNYARVEKFFPVMRSSKHIIFEGLFSHFARADEDSDTNELQIKRFNEALASFNREGFDFEIKHLANSGGAIFHPSSRMDMVRLGMVLYGLFEGIDLPEDISLKPAMTWKTQVVYFKFLEKGEGVGYGHHYIAQEDTRIVTLPVGYADGYQRAMGPKGKVIINDHIYPIAGRICMDQMMVDIGIEGEAYKADEVILVGLSKSHNISFFDIATWSDTSIYELLCQISSRVPRHYLNEAYKNRT